ncbi:MAG: NADH-quinone oxidoreductase subunit N [Bacteroidetes bacterium]|nr:NADH-quinone oxidoreductase subunit N [Bacteroidota bacterium]
MNLEILLSTPAIYSAFALAILLVIVDALTKKESKLQMIVAFAGLCFIIAQSCYNVVYEVNLISSDFVNEMLIFNNITAYFDILFCLAGLLTIAVSKDYLSKVYENYKEHYSLLIFAIFGMMCITHSNNLVVLFLGIETMSITFYAMTGFLRKRENAVDGALKYFLLGAFASGFLLYGMAMIYGATGSMYYDSIAISLSNDAAIPLYFKLGIGLLLIGLLFKVAAFPFHQWAPDVYQCAGTTTAGFMSSAGKVAALSGFIGIFLLAIPKESIYTAEIILIIAVVSALTMLVGNITALKQTNIKRMLAYSSVGHAGYMLMGIVANSGEGTSAILYYSLAYILTQIGAFTIIAIIETKEETGLTLSEYAGLSKRYPFLSATLAIFLFSLAGIPPFAGFFGKYYLFVAAINSGWTWLTIVAVITSVIACYFYLSVIVAMYFKDGTEELAPIKTIVLSKAVILIAAIGIVVISLVPFLDMM